MSEHIITDRELRAVKRQAKLRSRTDKNLTYMQHLDAVSRELHGFSFTESQQKAQSQGRGRHSASAQAMTPTLSVSLYMQACQDAYFDI